MVASEKTLENLEIKKTNTVLINDRYNHPKTSLLTFHFAPRLLATSSARFQHASIKHGSIEGKNIYILDDFLTMSESQNLREFSKTAEYSRNSYGSPESIEKGEKPARSMNNKERWMFFSNPPVAVKELFNLLGMIAHAMDAEVTTLPWELCDGNTGSPSVIANFLEELSSESMEFGKHHDSNPEEGICFGIPILYSGENKFHSGNFINGDPGKPWLVSLMCYSTADNFQPEYCMGTVFYKNNEEIALSTDCRDARLILFEGDIIHSIEQSQIPPGNNTWRVSYVFKLIINPKRNDQNVKKEFFSLVQKLSSQIDPISVGPSARI